MRKVIYQLILSSEAETLEARVSLNQNHLGRIAGAQDLLHQKSLWVETKDMQNLQGDLRHTKVGNPYFKGKSSPTGTKKNTG